MARHWVIILERQIVIHSEVDIDSDEARSIGLSALKNEMSQWLEEQIYSVEPTTAVKVFGIDEEVGKLMTPDISI